MISDSHVAYVWVTFWVCVLHSIGPLCTFCCLSNAFFPFFAILPYFIKYWAFAEAGFYVGSLIYQEVHLQRPAIHPARPTEEARRKLFERCQDSTHDYKSYIEKWFMGSPLASIGRENIKEFFRWAFFDSAIFEPEYDEEIDDYVANVEETLGIEFQPGRSDVKCIRLTIDRVGALHRSLSWYMVSGVMVCILRDDDC